MIRFEHANLLVKDIDETLDFILTAFPEWRVRRRGRMNWRGTPRRWLHVGDDHTYITLNDPSEGENRDLSGHQPGLAHLGFVVDDLDAVVARLERKGFPIDIVGEAHPFRRSVYFLEPAGHQFEFVEYLSEDPAERNRYDVNPTITLEPAEGGTHG
ncbi:VOC family protein [Sulfidibacter corallicola]|uniref:VOC family protein n=1 Tax=Sulfidibacter corallicola TaxID=2818388 RepID=A0A8A4THE9_SULCO|nr:VOC family protein [Sulfidibacter corallicola]QTD49063.1 VOC family protein [Sulfidibacter corallicola]